MSAQFQGFAASNGLVVVEQIFGGVRPAGAVDLRGMAVSSSGEVLMTLDLGQPRVFMNGLAFEEATGAVLFEEVAPFNTTNGGLLVDANGALVVTNDLPDVIHQGVGLLNSGALCNLGTGEELVVNGDFSNGTTGWLTSGSPNFTVTDGRAHMNGSGGIFQDVACEQGRQYRFKATGFKTGNNIARIRAYEGGAFTTLLGNADFPQGVDTTASFLVTATTASLRVYVQVLTEELSFDDVSVR